MKKRVAFIGLGKQNTEDHLVAALKSENVEIVAVCDTNKALAKQWAKSLGVACYYSVDELIDGAGLDAAVVAVPHNQHVEITCKLLQKGVHVFKEKPLAITLSEAWELSNIAKKKKVNLTVSVQRKHSRVYQTYLEYAKYIGDVFSIHGEYTMNIDRLDEGWRSKKEIAGGGAVLDMGYHLIDLIVWYFGVPDRISADLGYHNRLSQTYDVEDTAKIQFSYDKGKRRILGSLLISRIYPQKDEGLFIYGVNGAIKIYKNKIDLYDINRELQESTFVKANGQDVQLQFDSFIASITAGDYTGNHEDHLKDMVFIDAIYCSDAKSRTVLPRQDKAYKDYLR